MSRGLGKGGQKAEGRRQKAEGRGFDSLRTLCLCAVCVIVLAGFNEFNLALILATHTRHRFGSDF